MQIRNKTFSQFPPVLLTPKWYFWPHACIQKCMSYWQSSVAHNYSKIFIHCRNLMISYHGNINMTNDLITCSQEIQKKKQYLYNVTEFTEWQVFYLCGNQQHFLNYNSALQSFTTTIFVLHISETSTNPTKTPTTAITSVIYDNLLSQWYMVVTFHRTKIFSKKTFKRTMYNLQVFFYLCKPVLNCRVYNVTM